MTTAITKTRKPGSGRITKWNETYIDKVEDYLNDCTREQTKLASVEGYVRYVGIVKDTAYNWIKKYPEFASAIQKITDRQKEQLMEDGFYGGKEVNANMGIFLLKVNHGMIPNESKISINTQGETKILVVPNELIGKYGLSQNTEHSGPEQGEVQSS